MWLRPPPEDGQTGWVFRLGLSSFILVIPNGFLSIEGSEEKFVHSKAKLFSPAIERKPCFWALGFGS